MKVSILGKNGLKVVDLNRRKAIRERCLNCAGWSYKEVTKCEFDDCDLHPFRSGTGKQNPKNRSKAIRDYCLWCCAEQLMEVSKCPCTDCRPICQYSSISFVLAVERTRNLASL